MLMTHLLGGNFKCLTPHVDLLIDIKTGDDEEDPGPPGSSCQQPAQSEDDGSLVLLNRNDNYLLIWGFTGWQESNCSDNIELCSSSFLVLPGRLSPRTPEREGEPAGWAAGRRLWGAERRARVPPRSLVRQHYQSYSARDGMGWDTTWNVFIFPPWLHWLGIIGVFKLKIFS